MSSKIRGFIGEYPKTSFALITVLGFSLYTSPKDDPAPVHDSYISWSTHGPDGHYHWPLAIDPLAFIHKAHSSQEIIAKVKTLSPDAAEPSASAQALPIAPLAQTQIAVTKLKTGPTIHCYSGTEVKYEIYDTIRVNGDDTDPSAQVCLETDDIHVMHKSTPGSYAVVMAMAINPNYNDTTTPFGSLQTTFSSMSSEKCNTITISLQNYAEALLHDEGGLSSDYSSPIELTVAGDHQPACAIPIPVSPLVKKASK